MLSKYLYDSGETIYRVLAENDDGLLVIDCLKRTMPFWIQKDKLSMYQCVDDQLLHKKSGIRLVSEESLSRDALACTHKRYSIIASIVPVVGDKKRRDKTIAYVAKERSISKQTIRVC